MYALDYPIDASDLAFVRDRLLEALGDGYRVETEFTAERAYLQVFGPSGARIRNEVMLARTRNTRAGRRVVSAMLTSMRRGARPPWTALALAVFALLAVLLVGHCYGPTRLPHFTPEILR